MSTVNNPFSLLPVHNRQQKTKGHKSDNISEHIDKKSRQSLWYPDKQNIVLFPQTNADLCGNLYNWLCGHTLH